MNYLSTEAAAGIETCDGPATDLEARRPAAAGHVALAQQRLAQQDSGDDEPAVTTAFRPDERQRETERLCKVHPPAELAVPADALVEPRVRNGGRGGSCGPVKQVHLVEVGVQAAFGSAAAASAMNLPQTPRRATAGSQ